jgi:hypothetical protein
VKNVFLKGIILGSILGAGFSILDKRTDKVVTNTIIGAIAGCIVLNILNKKMK